MRKYYLIILLLGFCGHYDLHAQGDPQLEWVFNAVNASVRGGSTDGRSIAVDASGNRYVTGYFQRTADFDPSTATANLTSTSETQDPFIAKYDANGNYLWAKSISGSGNDCAFAIAVDGSGQVHIAGRFQNTADFDPSGTTAYLGASIDYDTFIAKYDTNGNYLWAKSLAGTGNEVANAIAINSSGQVHITGNFQGNVDFDPSATNVNLSAVGNQDIYIAKYDADGNYLWAKAIGGSSNEDAKGITLDSSGQVHITGYFQGTTDFDPSGATVNLTSIGGLSADIFIAKYDVNGNYLWAKSIGGNGSDVANGIALDNSGQVHITGYFQGTADFNPSGAVANLSSVGFDEVYIAKYDINGNYLWAKSLAGTGGDSAYAIALDSSGQVHIAGHFSGICDFDPSVATANFTSVGGQDFFIAKYNVNGNYLWAKALGGTGTDLALALALDSNGQINCTGFFNNTVDFDPSVVTMNLTVASGNNNCFVATYTTAGDYSNAFAIGGYSPVINNEVARAITKDNQGNVYMTGYFQGTTDFDPSAATASLNSVGSSDIFIAKYDASGNYLWAKAIGGTNNDNATAIAVDGSGHIYITGSFQTTADFDPSAATANLTEVGSADIFIAKYDANGNYLWAKSMGGTGSDIPNAIAVDGSGQVHITGYFQATADFDPSAAIANLTPVSGSQDIFIAKYDANGNYSWAKAMGGTNIDYSNGLALDASGQVHITGYFYSTADFDPSTATALLTSVGSADIFIAKYDASGNYLWAKAMGGTNAEISNALALDVSGQIHITGFFQTTADFDPSTATANLTTNGTSNDVFIAKYDASGNYLWAKAINGNLNDAAYAIALDSNDNLHIAGIFDGTADFDPTAATALLTSVGGSPDIFIAKYDASGNYLWAKAMGGTSMVVAYAIAVDGSRQIHIAGSFQETADFEPLNATGNLTSLNSIDLFLAKYVECTAATIPTVGASATTICFSGNTTLSITAGSLNSATNWQWYKDSCGGTSLGIGTSITVNPLATTTYYVRGEGGCTTPGSCASITITVEDTVAPIAPILSDVTAQCSATPTTPTTTDNCAGTISGTATTSFPITTQGTTVVTWTFDDGNGNTITADQNVIIDDTTAPVAPSLTDVTAQCSATPTAPTTIDSCAGIISGTTTTSFPITTQGTTVVTWTFDDGNGNTITADQNVIIDDTTAPVAPSLTDVTAQCSATPTAPTTTDNCAGIITGTTTTSFPITTQGITVVTWTFDDGNGNTITADQNVIIDDTTAPVAPSLIDLTEQCSATPTAPTTTDSCAGIISGTTTTSFPITTQGSTVVTWTFDDGNGNTITANQNVIIDDTTAPVAPSLTDVTAQCSATPTTPTTTDNCAGTISGTTTTSFPITTQGTTVVTWTFDDGNGNTSTTTQNVILNNTTDTTVTLSGGTLTAVSTADSYQWIDCNNGNAIIPLATNQSYTPTIDGNYAVILTVGGCNSTSACQAVLDAKDFDFGLLQLYPNPTTGNFVIKLPYAIETSEVLINDMLGKTIKKMIFNYQQELQLSLEGTADGVYFIQLRSDQKIKTFKIIKKN